MSNLCNNKDKEISAYKKFLNANHVLVLALPSAFLGIVQKYKKKNSNQSFKLYTDFNTLLLEKYDAILVDNTMPEYYNFAKDIYRRFDKKPDVYVMIDGKYVTDMKIVYTKYNKNGKGN